MSAEAEAAGARPLVVARAAVARNGVIGRRGTLPWRLPSDLRRFRNETWGQVLLMGRNTYESIGRPLDGRTTVVVSGDRRFAPPGVTVVASPAEGLVVALELAAARGAREVAVVGGGEIYRALLGRADRLVLTEVDAEPEGDVVFPPLDESAWRLVERRPLEPDPRDTARASVAVYERTTPAAQRTR